MSAVEDLAAVHQVQEQDIGALLDKFSMVTIGGNVRLASWQSDPVTPGSQQLSCYDRMPFGFCLKDATV
jgi:hypothetical protein